MADYFVRGATGNDGAAGTSGATARQRHSAIAALAVAAGSNVYHTEQQDATALANFTAAGLSFKNEPGSGGVTPANIRGVTFPAAGSWTATGTNSYVQNIGTGKTIAAVIDRWTQRIDSNGRRACYLAQVADNVAVDAAANSWSYNSGTGNLYVRLNDGTNPATLTGEDRVGYITSHAGCLVASGGGAVVEDLRWEFVRPAGATAAYQLHMDNGGNTVRRCGGHDASVHHLTFLSCLNDVAEDCVFYGGGQQATGGESNTPIAAYSAVTSVRGLRLRRCILHCYSFLAPGGSPVNSSASVSGVKIHTDGFGGRVVEDVELEDCWSYHYGQTGQLIDVSNTGSAPADPLSYSSFPVRVTGGGSRGCRQLSHDHNGVYRGVFFDFTAIASVSDLYAFWVRAARTATCIGCVFVFDQGSQAGRSMFRVESGGELNLIECTIVNRSVNATGPHTVCLVAGTSFKLRWKRNIIKNAYTAGTITRLIGGDTGAAAGNYEMDGNVYHGIDSTKFSNDTSRDTQAEWLANVDPNGQVIDPLLADIQSADPLRAGALLPSSPLLVPSRKVLVPGYVSRGINGRANDGTIGAWKYGAVMTGSSTGSGSSSGGGIGRLSARTARS